MFPEGKCISAAQTLQFSEPKRNFRTAKGQICDQATCRRQQTIVAFSLDIVRVGRSQRCLPSLRSQRHPKGMLTSHQRRQNSALRSSSCNLIILHVKSEQTAFLHQITLRHFGITSHTTFPDTHADLPLSRLPVGAPSAAWVGCPERH